MLDRLLLLLAIVGMGYKIPLDSGLTFVLIYVKHYAQDRLNVLIQYIDTYFKIITIIVMFIS